MQLLQRVQGVYRDTQLEFLACTTKVPATVINDVPFISQFATPDYAEKVLKGSVPKSSDPKWQVSGAISSEEYAHWVTTICGMACTVMALEFFTKQHYQTISLAKEAHKAGVYILNQGHLSHMHYHEYANWVTQYGIKAMVYSRLSTRGIHYILSQGGLVIASVNPNIRGFTTANPLQRGGHLVLVTSYNTTDNTITFHNPSGFVNDGSHANHTLSMTQFQAFFAGRGIGLTLLQS